MSHSIDLSPYRAAGSRRFSLAHHKPDALPRGMTREIAQQALEQCHERMRSLQEKLYAQDEWSLLVIMQGMDAAGKDSAIEHVFSGLNPQGCDVHAFKIPSDEELDHDFLWRTTLRLPRRGHITIFNRSYYEEVLVVRVHPDLLDRQRLPSALASRRDIWKERYEDIGAYERHLTRNGTIVRKVFLNVSKEEQRQRMLKRLDQPEKLWKFSAGDIRERQRWADYRSAYQAAIGATSTNEAPWFIVPADRKWWARTVIASIIVDALDGLGLAFPRMPAQSKTELDGIRKALERGDI
jgi:PPK2 family polyphosphate:nucleotide phosphotransferase